MYGINVLRTRVRRWMVYNGTQLFLVLASLLGPLLSPSTPTVNSSDVVQLRYRNHIICNDSYNVVRFIAWQDVMGHKSILYS